jgi:hypothetical protein
MRLEEVDRFEGVVRGIDWFDTAVEICGKVKAQTKNRRPGRGRAQLFKNQTRKGRPPGKKDKVKIVFSR